MLSRFMGLMFFKVDTELDYLLTNGGSVASDLLVLNILEYREVLLMSFFIIFKGGVKSI